MGEAAAEPAPAAAAKGRVAPPMPWRTRLAVLAAGYFTDATRRADGTVNRRLLGVLDKGVPASATPRNGVASRDVVIDPATPLRARLFYPAGADKDHEGRRRPLPVIVFFHGGGFAYLSAASPAYDAACRRISRHAGAAVLSVDYRRAPEHRCPAAYDDGLAALRFLADPPTPPAAARRSTRRAASSPGTALAATARTTSRGATRWTRRPGPASPPSASGGSSPSSPSSAARSAPRPSSASTARPSSASRAPTGCGARSCPPAPAGIEDAPAFPPATVVVGGYDPLQDWQRRYCDALRARRKEVRVLEYPDAIHAFYVFPEFADAKDLMMKIKDIVAGSE